MAECRGMAGNLREASVSDPHGCICCERCVCSLDRRCDVGRLGDDVAAGTVFGERHGRGYLCNPDRDPAGHGRHDAVARIQQPKRRWISQDGLGDVRSAVDGALFADRWPEDRASGTINFDASDRFLSRR